MVSKELPGNSGRGWLSANGTECTLETTELWGLGKSLQADVLRDDFRGGGGRLKEEKGKAQSHTNSSEQG